MNKKEFTDTIINTLRLNSRDRFISRRHILSIALEKMKFLIAQKLLDRSLYREENLITNITCYELEEVEVVKCPIVEFRICSKIMKGTKKLPELIYSRYGDSIRLMSNVDTSERIDRTNPTDYIRDRKREGYREVPKYYIKDGYPYIIDSNIEVVDLQLITLKVRDAEKASCEGTDECKAEIAYEFIGSDKLTEVVRQETIKELMGTYMQIQPDERPDGNEKTI